MSETTYEEAIQCPKCGKPGDVRSIKPATNSRGRPCQVHTVFCVTKLCRWFDTAYFVQVNDDGTIPPAYTSATERSKYPKASAETESKVNEMLERQLQAETRPGGEIRNTQQ